MNKTYFLLNIGTVKSKGANTPYLDLLKNTFRSLYGKPDDIIQFTDAPSGYGGHIDRALADPEVGEFVAAPIDLFEPGAIQKMRDQSRSTGQNLVAKITDSTGTDNYWTIDPDLFYLNFNGVNREERLDWGTPTTLKPEQGIHINVAQFVDGAYHFQECIAYPHDVTVGWGWILFIRLLQRRHLIGQRDTSIQVNCVEYYENLVRNITDVPYLEDITEEQRSYYDVSRVTMLYEWEKNMFNNTIPESGFTEDNVFVENFYMVSDYQFSGLKLLHTLNKNSDTRLVFVHDTQQDKDQFESILANWTGNNTVDLGVTAEIQNQLEKFYTSFAPGEFETFWVYCKSVYHTHFLVREMLFVDDLASQCHVNNVFWMGDRGKLANLLLVPGLRLTATELHYQRNENIVSIVKVGPRYYHPDTYKKFRMTFRNSQTGKTQAITWQLKDHLLAQKWARCNRYDYLERDFIAEKNYMLQHWEYDESNPNGRHMPALCAEMNRYVDIINAYFDGSSETRVDYHITQYFDPATINQDILNEIHHHFEVLIGQVWNISDYFKKADKPTCFAIRQLNNLCHEMESLRRRGPRDSKYWDAYIYFPMLPGERYRFVEGDYDHWQRPRVFGDLQLHYAQLGKTPLEAWGGRDEVIFDDNISGLRYLSGEFIINFSSDIPWDEQLFHIAKNDEKFFPWLRSRGQDPESKYTGVGHIVIGSFDRDEWPGKSAEDIMIELFNYDDIYRLELFGADDTLLAEATLDYTWRDVLERTDPTRNSEL
jgi:hypothetical protein